MSDESPMHLFVTWVLKKRRMEERKEESQEKDNEEGSWDTKKKKKGEGELTTQAIKETLRILIL